MRRGQRPLPHYRYGLSAPHGTDDGLRLNALLDVERPGDEPHNVQSVSRLRLPANVVPARDFRCGRLYITSTYHDYSVMGQ